MRLHVMRELQQRPGSSKRHPSARQLAASAAHQRPASAVPASTPASGRVEKPASITITSACVLNGFRQQRIRAATGGEQHEHEGSHAHHGDGMSAGEEKDNSAVPSAQLDVGAHARLDGRLDGLRVPATERDGDGHRAAPAEVEDAAVSLAQPFVRQMQPPRRVFPQRIDARLVEHRDGADASNTSARCWSSSPR